MIENIRKELEESQEVLNSFLADDNNINAISRASSLMVEALKNRSKLMACGNGGSACDAMHFCEELTGRFREDRDPFAAICLNSDIGHITCTANDFGYNRIFSRLIRALGHKGDVLLAISTSGNSENILTAVEAAKQKGIKVIGLTGNSGGKLAEFCDVEIRVPHTGFSDRIQEIHIKIIHILVLMIEKKMVINH
jgi:D-sedoheptulose 7-phosphate isomerase